MAEEFINGKFLRCGSGRGWTDMVCIFRTKTYMCNIVELCDILNRARKVDCLRTVLFCVLDGFFCFYVVYSYHYISPMAAKSLGFRIFIM